MESKNRAGRIGGRVLAGLVGLAATVCVVGAVLTVTPAGARTTPHSRTVTPVPATATAACPGPLLTVTSGTGTDTLAAVGSPGVVSGGGTESPTAGDLASAGVAAGATPARYFEQPALRGVSPLLAVAQSATGSGSELSGFAATNCTQPGYDSWLVGGATSLGTTTLVVLSNPGDVAATVSLDVYDEQGLVQAAGGESIPVPPHAQRIEPLAGLAPNASATVVHVTTSGSTVSAALQESQVTGITPQGIEWVSPAASPATHLVIPGAVIDTSALSAGTGSDSNGGVPVLRVLPVGGSEAKLTISVKPASGGAGGAALTQTVSPGSVSEIPLDHVSAGDYTITVDSNVPVVGAVGTSTVNAKGTDFTWYDSAEPLTGAATIPLAAGGGKELHLVNTSGSAVTVTFSGVLSETVEIPAGGAYVKAVPDTGVLTTSDAGGVYASVSYTGPGQLSSYVAYPTGSAASTLRVYSR